MPRAKSPGQVEVDGVMRCGSALAKGGDGRCMNRAGAGTDHPGYGNCKWHGGSTPAGRKAGARQQVRAEIPVFGNPVDASMGPEEILLGEVRRSAGVVYWMADQIAQWETDPEGEKMSTTGKNAQALLRVTDNGPTRAAWLSIYGEERDRLVRHTKACLDAGIAERQVRITEDLAKTVAFTLGAIIRDLGLTAEQRAVYPEVARRHLTTMQGGTS